MIKLLFISAAPIQNIAPFRILSQKSDVQLTVAYCTLPQAQIKKSREYINQEAFDIEVLGNDYSWVHVKNYALRPGLGHFFGLFNPGLVKLIRKHDVIIIYGHAYLSFVMSIFFTKILGKYLVLTSDATHIESPDKKSWKAGIKRRFLPWLYRHVADRVFVPSSKAKQFLMGLGIPPARITRTGYTVDNDYIRSVSLETDFQKVRHALGIPWNATVAIFCAKFIDRKRPLDAVRAFIQADVAGSHLLMVGDGPLTHKLKAFVEQRGFQNRVHFTGLVKYSKLHQLYTVSNLLLFCSETEQFGLPINEAMICGLPVLVSDRIGAIDDLVEDGITGFVYPCGDVNVLANHLSYLLRDPKKLKALGKAGQEKIAAYSPAFNAENIYHSILKVNDSRQVKKFSNTSQ